MNLHNALILLSEVISKIDNVEATQRLQFSMEEFRRLNNISFINHLPSFNVDKNYILVNGMKVMVGTILKRPLDIYETFSSMNIEYHYAAVLGTSMEGKEILIEMTKARNVSLVTKQQFLTERFTETQIGIEYLSSGDITREDIIKRAEVFQFKRYNLLDLNCKIFVEYVVLDIPIPQRTLKFKKFQIHVCEFAKNMLKIQLADPRNEKYKDFLIRRINESEKAKRRLTLAISEKENDC